MLNAIKNFFEQHMVDSDGAEADTGHRLKLATAALLIEIMQQDHQVNAAERETVHAILREKFALTDEETRDLYELAADEAEEAVDYFQFTNLIARECSAEEKFQVIEYLWQIAYADNHLDALEEHMIRRIADLIYVPHREMIQARHRVEAEDPARGTDS